jgi:hypothetical protein
MSGNPLTRNWVGALRFSPAVARSESLPVTKQEPRPNSTPQAKAVAFFSTRLHLYPAKPIMEVSETIQCPYCGASFELVVDTSVPNQRFTTDCEVCCRPFEVIAECEIGEILSLQVAGQ